jgi:hypothetical protein
MRLVIRSMLAAALLGITAGTVAAQGWSVTEIRHDNYRRQTAPRYDRSFGSPATPPAGSPAGPETSRRQRMRQQIEQERRDQPIIPGLLPTPPLIPPSR